MTSKNENSTNCSRRGFLQRSAVAGVATYSALSLARSAHAAGSDVIKFGLIGCGGRGTGAADNAMNAGKDVRLVAMADLFDDFLQGSRNALKRKKPDQVAVDDDHCFVGFDGYKRVIDSGVDAVVIACTSHFHPMFVKAAIDAGKHVFVEKPVGIDPTGVKLAAAASEEAKKKNLCVVSGLCWRYDGAMREIVKRIHDGQIGTVMSAEATRLGDTYVARPRKPDWSEMQYQMRNWYHFNWLSGGNPVQSVVHQLDLASWAMGYAAPQRAFGVGGRQVCVDPNKHGDEFDHHAMVYQYDNGVRLYSNSRHIPGCYNWTGVIIMGTKGRAYLSGKPGNKPVIEGENPWRYQGPPPGAGMNDNEHAELFAAIRAGKTINNGHYMYNTGMLGILGGVVCCTGQQTTWDEVMKSNHSYALPRYGWDVEPPVKPGPDGNYPAILPGVTKFS